MRGSLRTQLTLWNSVSLALLLTGVGVLVRYTVRSALMTSVSRAMERQVGKLPFGEGEQGPGAPPEGPGDGGGGFGMQGKPAPRGEEDITLTPRHFDLQGNALGFRSMLSQESFAVAAHEGRRDTRRIVLQGEPIQILSVPMLHAGRLTGVGQVGYRLTELEEAIATLDRTLLLLLPVGLLCASLGGILLTQRVLRRIHAVSVAAQEITAQVGVEDQALVRRLPVQGSDEFSELASVLNTLLGRQEEAWVQQYRALEQQRRFTGDASHELKSPLTVIKGTTSRALERTDVFTPEQYQHCLREIDQAADAMDRLVSDLLLLARSDSQQLGQQRIEVLASEILERALRLTPETAPPVTLQLPDPLVTLWGNEWELTRLFTNLLSNARRYTSPEGSVVVTVSAEEAWQVVRIADTGVGIAPEHLPHLGERFYRVDSSRNRGRGGTGLGLSICRSIVEAHGGQLVLTSALGEGTVVTVLLPPAREAGPPLAL
ncbi:sensor histidine kinase [Armatimonas rosea]|uniref:histidine kinase n=1 Tax=Armatimonas rosea TaxID=685828 RepID=A0A7W9SQW3_ARMRO|nr:HAMP domain-containing sensor histidine kinase [Armatimonas rosea]MBB6051161.1 signal transduction histidine kinase [Armatimonas rosea]